MRHPKHASSLARAFWRVVVVCAAVGYVVALGGTSAGQGWRLAPHLALAHSGPPPPALVDSPADGVVLSTLRPQAGHTHGGATHRHAADDIRTAVQNEPDDAGRHRHGDWVHDHRPPPPRRQAPVVALDKHHLPLITIVPAPLAASLGVMRADETRDTRTLPVETPPPVGRG